MALTTTCPTPSNINPLSSNGFTFAITKLPEITFFCQEVTLPSISMPFFEMNTPLSMMPIGGDIIAYDDLSIQFIVDQNLTNYIAIYNWITGLGFPTTHDQYSDFIDQQTIGYTRITKEYSNAVLTILGSNNQPVKAVNFVDILPVSLGSMTFQSTATDVNYITGTASFKISKYEFL